MFLTIDKFIKLIRKSKFSIYLYGYKQRDETNIPDAIEFVGNRIESIQTVINNIKVCHKCGHLISWNPAYGTKVEKKIKENTYTRDDIIEYVYTCKRCQEDIEICTKCKQPIKEEIKK